MGSSYQYITFLSDCRTIAQDNTAFVSSVRVSCGNNILELLVEKDAMSKFCTISEFEIVSIFESKGIERNAKSILPVLSPPFGFTKPFSLAHKFVK